MKKLILFLSLLLIIPVGVWALMSPGMGGQMVPSGGGYACADDVCAGCLFQERFECGSTNGNEEESWVDQGGTGTWDEDYTTSPAPLQGTESLQNASNEQRRGTWSGTDSKIYIGFTFYIESGSTTGQYLMYLNATTGRLRLMYSVDHWTIRLYYNNTVANADGTFNITTGTQYWLKYEYDNGSGVNGYHAIYITSTKPESSWGAADVEVSDATDTVQGTTMDFRMTDPTIIDDIKVDDATILY